MNNEELEIPEFNQEEHDRAVALWLSKPDNKVTICPSAPPATEREKRMEKILAKYK
jgi:hypothetical protein